MSSWYRAFFPISAFFQWWTVIMACEPNKSCPPQLYFDHAVYHSTKKETRTVNDLDFLPDCFFFRSFAVLYFTALLWHLISLSLHTMSIFFISCFLRYNYNFGVLGFWIIQFLEVYCLIFGVFFLRWLSSCYWLLV